VPRPIERELWLPGSNGRPELIERVAEPSTAVNVERIELERAG
jgi:hypothetical protein